VVQRRVPTLLKAEELDAEKEEAHSPSSDSFTSDAGGAGAFVRGPACADAASVA
jgi:hypothetical protein